MGIGEFMGVRGNERDPNALSLAMARKGLWSRSSSLQEDCACRQEDLLPRCGKCMGLEPNVLLINEQRHLPSRHRFARWGVGVCLVAGVIGLNANMSGSLTSTGHRWIITGSVSECGGGPLNKIVRDVTVSLHKSDSKILLQSETIFAGSTLHDYAFSVRPGTYVVSINMPNALRSRVAFAIRKTSPTTMVTNFASTCQ